MHEHGNDNKSAAYKRMAWMMLPCLLLMGVLLFGGEKLASSGYLWPIIFGICVVPHVWMMLRGRGGHCAVDENGGAVSRDPVCGMKSTGGIDCVHGGNKYSFCSDHCRRQFQVDPARYTKK